MKYRIYYGKSTPYKFEAFATWKEACEFMKMCLDNGTCINSVNLEHQYEIQT